MPCYDSRVDDDHRLTSQRLDRATRVACEAFRSMTPEAIRDKLSQEAQRWWYNHQEMDRKRLAAEEAARQRAKAKRDALAKLTPAERKALGL